MRGVGIPDRLRRPRELCLRWATVETVPDRHAQFASDDSPFSDAGAVLVTFRGVRAHRSESDWAPVPFAEQLP